MKEVVNKLKEQCKALFDKLPKDEDNCVVFKDEDVLYLTDVFFDRGYIREVNGVSFEEDGSVWFWEHKRDDFFNLTTYDESEYEVFSKLLVILSNM